MKKFHPLKNRSRQRSATASVEFALILILFIPILMGVWEIGRLINIQQRIQNATREGARQASTAEKSTAEVKQFVLDYLGTAGFTKIKNFAGSIDDLQTGGKVFVGVKVFNTNGVEISGGDVKDALQNYKVEVTVAVLYNDVQYSPTHYFLSSNRTIAATVTWHCMRDVPLKVNQAIPLS